MKARELWRELSPRLIINYSHIHERLAYEQRQWEAAIQGIELDEPDWNDEQAREERKMSLSRIEWLKKKLAEKRAAGILPDPARIEESIREKRGKVIGLNTQTEDALMKELKRQGAV